jgi:tRNA(fMet)-specific endonuclease VapC
MAYLLDTNLCAAYLNGRSDSIRQRLDGLSPESIVVCSVVRAAAEYARVRASLERRDEVIGANDLLIASIALANDLTLVTHNVNEFRRVPSLRIEDWE